MGLCSSAEHNCFTGRIFDVMFDPEDIMEFTSYGKGREILKNMMLNCKVLFYGKVEN